MKAEIAKALALISTEYEVAFDNARVKIWMAALEKFPPGVVANGVAAYLRDPDKGRFKPKIADIIGKCQIAMGGNGWLAADEAWARAPKSESESAMLTNEIVEALAVASECDDRIAARMAFKSTYDRLVDAARLEGRAPHYFISAGRDKRGLQKALSDGVKAGQIGIDAAVALLPPDYAEALIVEAGIKNHPLLAAPASQAGRAQLKALMNTLKVTA